MSDDDETPGHTLLLHSAFAAEYALSFCSCQTTVNKAMGTAMWLNSVQTVAHSVASTKKHRSLFALVCHDPVVAVAAHAGVRRLLFRQAEQASTEPPHMFKYRAPATGPAALGLCDPLGVVDVEVDVVDVVEAGARLRKGMAVQAKGVAKAQVKDQDAGGLCAQAL